MQFWQAIIFPAIVLLLALGALFWLRHEKQRLAEDSRADTAKKARFSGWPQMTKLSSYELSRYKKA